MYDIFASEYSYDIKTFMSLSAREVDLLLEKISERTYTRYEREAQLHGFKLAPRVSSKFSDDVFSEEQVNKAEAAILETQKRKLREIENKRRG